MGFFFVCLPDKHLKSDQVVSQSIEQKIYSNTDACFSFTTNKINIQYNINKQEYFTYLSLALSLFYLSILVGCRHNECCCLLERVDLNKMPAQNIQL